jgi:formate dehydrogenase beta subunit
MITPVSCHFCASRCGLLLNIENERAIKLMKAPCEKVCPAGIDIPRYVRLIADERFDDAIAVIREKVPFPAVLGCVCTHPCERECLRGTSDEPVSIKALKYFVARNDRGAWKKESKIAKSTGKRVAVIGSGPSGLTAAYYLIKRGHGVTVFEKLPVTGGMLRVGIPAYRLPREILDKEIDIITEMGVDIITGTEIESLDTLFEQGYDAVYVSTGAHKGLGLNITGEESDKVNDCVSFLKEVNLGQKVNVGNRVAVVGGGYAAVDAARTALRLGAKEVSILYRRTVSEMPASSEEIEEAMAEGVKILFLVAPSRIIHRDGKVKLECSRMRLGAPDASNRRQPEPISGSEFTLEFDNIIAAIGQRPDTVTGFKIDVNPNGTIKVTQSGLATNRQGVFAGGDVVSGPASVIEAIADGRRAASSIDQYLGGEGTIDEVLAIPWGLMSPGGVGEVEGFKNRIQGDMLLAKERIKSFTQVEASLTKEQAIENAKRCFWCDMADGNPEHPYSLGWSCKRGRAHTARYYQYSTPVSE